MRTPISGRWFDRVALGFVGTCVVSLYAATLSDFAAPHVPGAAATGMVSTALSASVPELRQMHVSDGQEARTLQPVSMAKVSFPPPAPLPVRVAAVPDRAHPLIAETTGEVKRLYDALGYELSGVAEGNMVPRLYLAAVPEDLRGLDDVETRKSVFIRTVLPLILRVNEEVARDRARLKEIDARLRGGDAVHPSDIGWVHELGRAYGVRDGSIAKLLRKVDVVPPSLALAQAIEESGWGTSRFAREANALFGQWTTDPRAPGIETGVSPSDPNYRNRIRAFPSLLDAVRSYVRNLNTHRAYAAFREERWRQRRGGEGLNGYQLADTLLRYSERGTAYTQALRALIRSNDLMVFDDSRLGSLGMQLAAR